MSHPHNPKTDYAAHDALYQQKQARGQAGWDPAAISAEVWHQFAQMMKHDAIPRAGRLLELGCGAGNLSVGFARLGYHVTAVDISPTAITWAQQRAAKEGLAIDFLVSDVLKLDQLDNASFAVVVDSHCFHCIIGDDRARFLENAKRLLAPGGALLLNCMIQNDRTPTLQGFDPDTGIVWRGEIATRTVSTQQAIEAELQRVGFVCLDSQAHDDGEVADTLMIIARIGENRK